MSEMVERVAKVLYENINLTSTEQARLAIEAMREPTEAMVEHAWEEVPHTIEAMSGQPDAQTQIKGFWQAMIDEARK